MKSLEILLRLIDQLLNSIRLRKNQNERNAVEKNPDTWFSNHFNGMQSKDDKANKANASD